MVLQYVPKVGAIVDDLSSYSIDLFPDINDWEFADGQISTWKYRHHVLQFTGSETGA